MGQQEVRRGDSLNKYDELRTDLGDGTCRQWTKSDIFKFFTCSILILQYFDISNGRVLKMLTSIPGLYYSYRCSLEKDQLPPQFSSIVTPLALYWVLECVATFATFDMADMLMYIALKTCLVGVLRWKINQSDCFLSSNKIQESPECAMDNSEVYNTMGYITSYRTIAKYFDRTIYSPKPKNLKMRSANHCPFSRNKCLPKQMHADVNSADHSWLPQNTSTHSLTTVDDQEEAVLNIRPATRYRKYHDGSISSPKSRDLNVISANHFPSSQSEYSPNTMDVDVNSDDHCLPSQCTWTNSFNTVVDQESVMSPEFFIPESYGGELITFSVTNSVDNGENHENATSYRTLATYCDGTIRPPLSWDQSTTSANHSPSSRNDCSPKPTDVDVNTADCLLSEYTWMNSFNTVDDQESVMSLAVFVPEHNGEDLITNPMCTLEFPRFGRRRCKKITMSNVSQRKILWKLRSNIAHFLLATPTAGILEAGQHDYVKVTMNDNCIENGKIVISYAFVSGSTQRLDRESLDLSYCTNHILDVVFR